MTWYCAHIVMQVRFKDGIQDVFPVWENIYLISAHSSEELEAKADAIGVANEGDSNNSFLWNERPAEWVFRGVRKIIKVTNSNSIKNEIGDGAEVTYQTLEFDNEKSLEDFLSCEPAKIRLVD